MIMRRVGRPGLLGVAARTAVVAGTATAVTGGMTRRANRKAMEEQQVTAADQAQQQPAPTAAAPADDTVTKLRELSDMKANGTLSEQEFEAAKAKLLG